MIDGFKILFLLITSQFVLFGEIAHPSYISFLKGKQMKETSYNNKTKNIDTIYSKWNV